MVATAQQLHPTQAGKVHLPKISWNTYSLLLEEIGDAPIRLTYDRGYLEIEVPSQTHEEWKDFVTQLITVSLLDSGTDFRSLGSTTWRRREIDRGLEADGCFYVQSYARVQNKKVDQAVDPPPDLAIEVDFTSSSIDKLDVYSTLKVPEVWRIFLDFRVEFLILGSEGAYVSVQQSLAIPRLSPALIQEHLKLCSTAGYSAALRNFNNALKTLA